MKGRSLLALSLLSLALACESSKEPTGPTAPVNAPKIISDGAHVGGNPDFFFLPPLVPLPFGNATFRANFELGKFNNALQPSLKIEICALDLTGTAKPVVSTLCAGNPIKTFDFGSVRLVNLPLRENGWWSLFGLPADGFYYVLWDTRQAGLDVTKYYRIKIFLDGFSLPLGYADVDPMSSLREWRYSATGDLVQLVNGTLLPIPFRVEKNGSPCRTGDQCVQQTVNNTGGLVLVPGGAGPLAGAEFPSGWLPPGGPQSVLVTISRVNTGSTNPDGTQAIQCHRNLPLWQFDGCFKFSTYPKLAPISTNYPGHQFQQPVRVAVCYLRAYGEDNFSDWVQLWASDDGANFRSLDDAGDGGILSPAARDCNTTIIGDNSPGFRGLANAGWRNVKAGLGEIFGVKTAYGIDLGLGGLIFDFSNISPALTANIDSWNLFGEGLSWTAFVKITGVPHHESSPAAGINGLPVRFTVTPANGNFGFDEGGPIYTRVVYTSTFYGEGPENGIASVGWNVASTPGVHTITANGPAFGGPILFTVTVPPPPPPIP